LVSAAFVSILGEVEAFSATFLTYFEIFLDVGFFFTTEGLVAGALSFAGI
jgi:hypothetical protein